MTTLTHTLIGAAVAKAVLATGRLGLDPTMVYTISIISANLPDLDIPIKGLRRSFYHNHRLYSFIHFPLFWVFFIALCSFIIPDGTWGKILPILPVIIVNLSLHFFFDLFTLNAGVCLLFPIIKKEFMITRPMEKPETVRLFVKSYAKSVLFKGEILINTLVLWYLLKKPM